MYYTHFIFLACFLFYSTAEWLSSRSIINEQMIHGLALTTTRRYLNSNASIMESLQHIQRFSSFHHFSIHHLQESMSKESEATEVEMRRGIDSLISSALRSDSVSLFNMALKLFWSPIKTSDTESEKDAKWPTLQAQLIRTTNIEDDRKLLFTRIQIPQLQSIGSGVILNFTNTPLQIPIPQLYPSSAELTTILPRTQLNHTDQELQQAIDYAQSSLKQKLSQLNPSNIKFLTSEREIVQHSPPLIVFPDSSRSSLTNTKHWLRYKLCGVFHYNNTSSDLLLIFEEISNNFRLPETLFPLKEIWLTHLTFSVSLNRNNNNNNNNSSSMSQTHSTHFTYYLTVKKNYYISWEIENNIYLDNDRSQRTILNQTACSLTSFTWTQNQKNFAFKKKRLQQQTSRNNNDTNYSLHVMSYNIWNFDSGSNPSWDQRKTWVADVIRDSQAEVIGLQEIRHNGDQNQLEDLATLLGSQYHFHFQPAMNYGTTEEGVGILSLYPLDDTLYIPLHLASTSADQNRRACLRAFIDTGDSKIGKVNFFVTHLSYAPDQQLAQTYDVYQFMEATDPDLYPQIVVADWNFYTGQPEDAAQFLLGELTFNSVTGNLFEAYQSNFTWSSWEPTNRADRIYYRPGVGTNASGASKLTSIATNVTGFPLDPSNKRSSCPSDHLAVQTWLRLAEPPPAVDCVGAWSNWTVCAGASDCGLTGHQTQTYTIFINSSGSGVPCPVANRSVVERECIVNCPEGSTACVGMWGPWTPCDVTCGGGYMERVFHVIEPETNGGPSCAPDYNGERQGQECNMQPCVCPNCTALHRLPCGSNNNTCGECIDGYASSNNRDACASGNIHGVIEFAQDTYFFPLKSEKKIVTILRHNGRDGIATASIVVLTKKPIINNTLTVQWGDGSDGMQDILVEPFISELWTDAIQLTITNVSGGVIGKVGTVSVSRSDLGERTSFVLGISIGALVGICVSGGICILIIIVAYCKRKKFSEWILRNAAGFRFTRFVDHQEIDNLAISRAKLETMEMSTIVSEVQYPEDRDEGLIDEGLDGSTIPLPQTSQSVLPQPPSTKGHAYVPVGVVDVGGGGESSETILFHNESAAGVK